VTTLRSLCLLCLLVVVAAPQAALAQFGITSRTAGMGGAGIANARGAEALYFNPSGLVLAQDLEVSVSANAYGYSSLTLEEFHRIVDERGEGAEGLPLEGSEVLILPSAAGAAYRWDFESSSHALGFGLFAPTERDFEAEAIFAPSTFPASRRSYVADEFSVLQGAGGYALRFGSFLGGVAVDGAFTSFERTNHSVETMPGYIPEAPVFYNHRESISGWAVDVRPSIGLGLELSSLKLGARGSFPFHVLGKADRISEFNLAAGDGNSIENSYETSLPVGALLPAELGFGASFDMGPVLVASDAVWSSAVHLASPALRVLDSPSRLASSLGVEVEIMRGIAARGGVGARVQLDNRIPTNKELAALNDRFENTTRLDIRDSARINLIREMENLRTHDANTFAASLGGAYTNDNRVIDVALVGILTSGEHLSRNDVLRDDGSVVFGMRRQPMSGWTVLLSIGGTLAPPPEEETPKPSAAPPPPASEEPDAGGKS
jgi:hypothetical protein